MSARHLYVSRFLLMLKEVLLPSPILLLLDYLGSNQD